MSAVCSNAGEQRVYGVFFAFQILHVDTIQVAEHPGHLKLRIDAAGPIKNGGQILSGVVKASAGVDKAYEHLTCYSGSVMLPRAADSGLSEINRCDATSVDVCVSTHSASVGSRIRRPACGCCSGGTARRGACRAIRLSGVRRPETEKKMVTTPSFKDLTS